MPQLEFIKEEAPEEPNKNESINSSNSSSINTPITASTSSSPSLDLPSPENLALLRILSANYNEDDDDNQRLAFPREQTLLDLLIQTSGIQDLRQLRQLRELRLKVLASTISLSRIESYTPNIRILRLDGSGLSSLREIGTGLMHLRILHVANCGLTNLDGTFGLSKLVELHAANNSITNVGPCVVLENIKAINLDRNPISSMNNVSLLSLCSKLYKLSLKGTPLSRQSNYRDALKALIPNLTKIDGISTDQDIEDDENSDSFKSMEINLKMSDTSFHSSEVSSMTSPSYDCERLSELSKSSDTDKIFEDARPSVRRNRPLTAPGIRADMRSERIQRPHSAQSSAIDSIIIDPDATPSYLTSGGIICGNIARALTRARPVKIPKRSTMKKPVDAWVIGPADDNEDDLKQFCQILNDAKQTMQEPLPQKPEETTPVVDLELGIAGASTSNEFHQITTLSEWENHSGRVLKISEQWRKAFKLYRRSKRSESTQNVLK